MSLFSTIFSFCPWRRIRLAAVLLIAAVIAFAAYDRLISAPERQHVVRRYDEFRAVVAAGNTNRMMQFVAPEFRDWAVDRLHLYGTFARPLDSRSTIRVSAVEATKSRIPVATSNFPYQDLPRELASTTNGKE